MTSSWSVADQLTNARFRQPESFAARFGALLEEVARAGFGDAELWTAHLNPAWATELHLSQARECARIHGMRLTGLGGDLGATPAALERSCKLVNAIDGDMLVGRMHLVEAERVEALAILRRYGVRLAIENETASPDDVLRQIGSDSDVLGAALDTASFLENGHDPVEATNALAPVAFHMHLRNCRGISDASPAPFDEGAVDVEACLAIALSHGAVGSLGIEVFARHENPTSELSRNRKLVEGWLLQRARDQRSIGKASR
jgi:sugar phosphate isomerase/epimerase